MRWIGWISLATSIVGCTGAGDPPPAPQLSGADPSLFCAAEKPTTLTISGESLSFAVQDTFTAEPRLVLPTVTLVPASGLGEGSDPVAATPITVPPEDVLWVDDGSLEVKVRPTLGVPSGIYHLRLEDTAGQQAVLSDALTVIGAPRVDAFEPPGVCQSNNTAFLGLSGADFVVVDGVMPTVLVGQREWDAVSVDGCSPILGQPGAEVCTFLEFAFPANQYNIGEVPLWVKNPDPGGCTSVERSWVQLEEGPGIAAVEPTELCINAGTPFTIEGSGFQPDSTVLIGGVEAESVVFVDENTLEVTFSPDTPLGTHDVAVITPAECYDVLTAGFTVTDVAPIELVDPEVLHEGSSFDVRAHVEAVGGEVTDLYLVGPGGTTYTVPWSWAPGDGGLVQFTAPDDLPAGSYDVVIVEDGVCENRTAGALEVSSQIDLALTEVVPAVLSNDDPAVVTLHGAGLQDPTRIFLVGPTGTYAEPVEAVAWDSADEVRFQVPAGTAVGIYDLLVTNPDGTLGRLDDALEVVGDPMPRVHGVTPEVLTPGVSTIALFHGENFRDPEVKVFCEAGFSWVNITAGIVSWQDDLIEANLPGAGLDGATCVATVTNADGTSARWEGMTLRDNAEALFPFTAGSTLQVARRAPAAAVLQTPTGRTAFAMGGDDGSPAGAKSTIELSTLDHLGAPGPWRFTRGLPGARTLAGVTTIGRYVYVIGGDDGAGATASVVRAFSQSLLDAPVPSAVDVHATSGAGLGGGTWTWRIAAIFASTDPYNPDGESVASLPVAVRLPDKGGALGVTLTWTAVPGAVGYRVFRSTTGVPGSEVYLTDVGNVTSFTDTGLVTTSTLLSKPDGALGSWVDVGDLSVARSAPCVAVAPDPNQADEHWIYVAGGLGAGGAALSDVERLDVTVLGPTEQSAGNWNDAGVSLSEARYQCGGATLESETSTDVAAGDAWVYFIGGRDAAGTATTTVDAGKVNNNGNLGSWQTVIGGNKKRAGMVAAGVSNTLCAVGGQNGNASADGNFAWLDPGAVPDLISWTGLGNTPVESRFLAGSARSGGLLLIVGGENGAALSSTEFTHF